MVGTSCGGGFSLRRDVFTREKVDEQNGQCTRNPLVLEFLERNKNAVP